jgi:DNA processing protein
MTESASLKGKTVAIWGTGIDVPYPRDHKRIAEAIVAGGGALVSEFPAESSRPLRISQFGTGSSAVGALVCWSSKPGNIAGRASPLVARWSRDGTSLLFRKTWPNRNSRGPNTLIRQGAKRTATWEDVWEDVPADIKLQLESTWRVESQVQSEASLVCGVSTLASRKAYFTHC